MVVDLDGDDDVNGVATVDLSRLCVNGGDHVQVHVAVNVDVHDDGADKTVMIDERLSPAQST